MKLRTDLPNEGRNNLLMIIGVIAFFFIAFKVTGQTELARRANFDYEINKPTTLIFPSEGLEFVTESKLDTVYLSVIADSISVRQYGIKLYTFLPKTSKFQGVKSIIIEFEDKSMFAYETSRTEVSEGYTEYNLSKLAYQKLVTTRIKKIYFNSVTLNVVKSDRDYFISFFNALATK